MFSLWTDYNSVLYVHFLCNGNVFFRSTGANKLKMVQWTDPDDDPI